MVKASKCLVMSVFTLRIVNKLHMGSTLCLPQRICYKGSISDTAPVCLAVLFVSIYTLVNHHGN